MSHSLVDGRGAARETDNVRPGPCVDLTPVCQSAVKARRAVNMDMKPRRREMAVLAVLGALLASAALAPAQAQTWPDKPIKLVVSFAPGGVHDTLARVLQPKLTEALRPPSAIENPPGAGGH